MPSPFPGMDPYLEGSLWSTVHTQLSAEIARQLAPRLRPLYLALTTERFVTVMPEDVAIATTAVFPNVSIAQVGRPQASAGTGTALAPPLRLATVMPESIPHVTVEIRDRDNRRLVAAIEVLSPANKRAEGYEEYVSKRQRLLLSAVHLLEIDLLRKGRRVPMQQPLPDDPYFVLLSRAQERPMTEVWPVWLDGPLPTIPVPLLPGDADVPLDLQVAFSAVYDAVGYDLAVDYSRPPEVPLSPAQATWAEQSLRRSREGNGKA